MKSAILLLGVASVFLSCSEKLNKSIVKSVLADSDSVHFSNLNSIKESLEQSRAVIFRPISNKNYRTIDNYLVEANRLYALQNLARRNCCPTSWNPQHIHPVDSFNIFPLTDSVSSSMNFLWRLDSQRIKIFEKTLNHAANQLNKVLTANSVQEMYRLEQACLCESIKLEEDRKLQYNEQRLNVHQARTAVLLAFPRAYRRLLKQATRPKANAPIDTSTTIIN